MKTILSWAGLIATAIAVPVAAQQAFTGRLSDSVCGASHQAKTVGSATAHGAEKLTDRQCLIACIKALGKYVLVDQSGQVIPIANQDAMGLPLYAGRPVKLTGERRGDAVLVTKVEAIPAHLHIGHVMTNWRDTPGTRGFLPVAIDEARVAVLHARLAAKSARLDDIQLHAGHVLNALDPTVEPGAPGAAGYGVRKAAAGARQHLDFAAGGRRRDGQHRDARRGGVFATRERPAMGGSGDRGGAENPRNERCRRSRRSGRRPCGPDAANQR